MANKKPLMGKLISRDSYLKTIKYGDSEIIVGSKETVNKIDFNKINEELPKTIIFVKEK